MIMQRFYNGIDPFAAAEGPPPQQLWPFVRWALSGSERAIALAIVVAMITGLSELVTARFTGWVIDVAGGEANPDFWASYWPVIVVGLGFFLIVRPLIFVTDASVSSVMLTPNIFPMVLARLNRHTMGQSMRYFDNDFAGRISQKALQTARAINDTVVEVIDAGIFGLAMFLGALLILATVDARLLIVFAIWASGYFAVLRHYIPRVQRSSAARAEARTQVTGLVVDTLSNIATVKLYAQDQEEDRSTLRTLAQFRESSFHFGTLAAQFRMLLMTVGGLLPMFSILGALFLWSKGQASPGDIAMVAMVTTRLSMVTNRLGRLAVGVFTNIGEIQDGMETLAVSHEIQDRPGAQSMTETSGAIRFDAVSFSYGGEASALRALSLEVEPGEKVALVGASGAGKSTMVSLLLRLHDVESGAISLDGIDIRDLTQLALRGQIAVVRQDTNMFNRSALENIRYGRPDASDEEVFEAARRASAHEFILGLRDHRGRSGYDARLGERGVKLSGGQRQRIALARAILADAPILVLDEATSALDSEVEAEIQEALETVMQGKTVIAIAHRLSTIAQMDRIVVLDQGEIVEEGTHDVLLAAKGTYARYWQRQSGGFLGAEGQEAAE